MTPNEAARSKQTSYLLLTFMALFFGGTWVAGKVAVRVAEIHWYEATGIGKKEFKIKRYL